MEIFLSCVSRHYSVSREHSREWCDVIFTTLFAILFVALPYANLPIIGIAAKPIPLFTPEVLINVRYLLIASILTMILEVILKFVDGRYSGDPFVAKHCDSCGAISPPSHIEGIGDDAVHCDNCGAEVSAFRFSNGYVIVLDRENAVSLTVGQEVADRIAGSTMPPSECPNTTIGRPAVSGRDESTLTAATASSITSS